MRRMLIGLLLVSAVYAQQQAWWDVYGDPELKRLVELALAENLDLKVATERIAESRALEGTAKSKLGPDINLTSSAQRLRGGFSQGIARIPQASGQKQSGSFVSPFETGLLQGGLDMKWELDFFGTNRAGRAAAEADRVAQEATKEDLAITVGAEVARVYVEYRGAEERLAITKQNVATQRDLLELTRSRAEAGLDSQVDVERQALLVSNTEATLPGLEAELAVKRNRLAVLVGDSVFVKAPLAAGRDLVTPQLPEGIASELLKRRPDVRAAEAKWTATQLRLKQAKTDLYPKVTLNGLLGRQGTGFTSLAYGGGNFFSFGPQLQLPLFNTWRIKSNIAANDARVEAARVEYEKEILVAFEEAENAIANYKQQQARTAKLSESLATAERSLGLLRDRQTAGLEDFLAVLDAQRSVFDAAYQRSSAKTQALTESVALFKALAGGWGK